MTTNIGSIALGGILWSQGVFPQEGTIGPTATVPDPPTDLVATTTRLSASIAFTAPTNNGGSAILSYTVTSSPGGFTATGSASPITVTDLSNGTSYTFTAVATNALGDSVASSVSNSVTPTLVLTRRVFTSNDVWVAPTGVTSVDYILVGGGGGGGGSSDNCGAGGGGGGVVETGTYAVVPGTSYTVVVGTGGAGGTGRGSTYPNPAIIPGINTDGTAGTSSSFDGGNEGPVAAGGGAGKKRDTIPTGQGGGISAGGNGGQGGRGGGGGGGAGGAGTNGAISSAGTGGIGVPFTIPGYNGGNSQSYGAGGNGGVNLSGQFTYIVGASGSVNTGKGGVGGSAASFAPALNSTTPVLITIGGAGGSGIVVLAYYA